MIKKILIIVIGLFLCFYVSGCGNNSSNNDEVKIIPGAKEVELTVGDTYQIDYKVENANATASFLDYDESVISISEEGLITAKKYGDTNVIVIIQADDEESSELLYEMTVNVSALKYWFLTFRTNVEDVKIDGVRVQQGKGYEFSAAPDVPRYIFKGYSTDAEGNNIITKLDKVDSNMIIYALYERKNTYMISYLVNGKKLEGYDQEIKPDELVDPTKVPCSEPGFIGWIASTMEPSIIKGELKLTGDTTFIAAIEKDTYNITYDFCGGDFEKTFYTIEELEQDFVKDYNKNGGNAQSAIDIDTAHIGSDTFAQIYSTKAMVAKWGWLYKALYKQAKCPSGCNPETDSLDGYSAKSFYICNICAFFTKTQHIDSNFKNESVDYSDITNQKDVLYQSTPKTSKLGPSTYNKGEITPLVPACQIGYVFMGWSFDGENIITELKENYIGDLILKAIWKETTKPNEFIPLNIPENGLKLYQPFKLDWNVLPIDAANKTVYFQSFNPKIFTVDDNGNIYPLSKGESKLRVKFEDNKNYELLIDIKVHAGDYFDIKYETTSYTTVGKPINLSASYYDELGVNHPVSWKSLDESLARVDDFGKVTPLKVGVSKIRAWYGENEEDHYIDFVVTILSDQISKELEFILNNHHSNASTSYNLGIGAGNPVYYYDVVGSVNNILFDNLNIDKTYYDTLKSGQKNYGPISKVEFITVHYTGSMNYGSDADNTCSYFNEPSYEASIHFVTGRSNLQKYGGDWSIDSYAAFAGCNEAYAAWHASTGRNEVVWDKTGIKYEEGDPEKPVISISKDLKYTINGKESIIKIPSLPGGYKLENGMITSGGTTCNAINDYGLLTKIVDGEYYLARTYWGTQRGPNALCTYGGNTNSIGIESCVDKGSDLMHTWHVTAQLVASLLVKYNLGFDRVVGHHFFSGKDCPQPLLENDMKLWYEFMDMVQAEYEVLTTYKDTNFSLKVIDGEDSINRLGLTYQSNDHQAKIVTYEITIEKDGKSETVTLATAIESNYSCDCLRNEASLQIANFEIK